jgi:hypothetical protein
MLRNQQHTRREVFKPKMYAKLEYSEPKIPYVKVTNVGKGTALEVNVSIESESHEKLVSYSSKFVEPNETIGFQTKKVNLDEMCKEYGIIIIKMTYKDIYDNSKTISQELSIDLNEEKQKIESGIILGKWVTEEIIKIRKELEHIKLEMIKQNNP